jgi:hypothetical protein
LPKVVVDFVEAMALLLQRTHQRWGVRSDGVRSDGVCGDGVCGAAPAGPQPGDLKQSLARFTVEGKHAFATRLPHQLRAQLLSNTLLHCTETLYFKVSQECL